MFAPAANGTTAVPSGCLDVVARARAVCRLDYLELDEGARDLLGVADGHPALTIEVGPDARDAIHGDSGAQERTIVALADRELDQFAGDLLSVAYGDPAKAVEVAPEAAGWCGGAVGVPAGGAE